MSQHHRQTRASGQLPPLPRDFYDRDAADVARELLGKCLIRVAPDGLTSGRIVEVEAYLAQDDPANHAFRGQTRRNASMFGPPGHAYVYAIHARWCLNAVTEPAGVASAVLIRAVEPLVGVELMTTRRRMDKPRDLARGPGRLCEAFAIAKDLDGCDLTKPSDLWITDSPDQPPTPAEILTATRIGISSGQTLALRFFLDSPFVSKRPRQRGDGRARSRTRA